MKEKFYFWVNIAVELLLFPFWYFIAWLSNTISSRNPLRVKKIRSQVEADEVLVVIHEWGGYSSVRKKKIKNGVPFSCGLAGQLERFILRNKDVKKKVYLTVSDLPLLKNQAELEQKVDMLLSVSNEGMDFSGYSAFYERIKDKPNAYVILSNTSVNVIQTEFLADYIKYMESNLDVGMLGVSYCSKTWQSLIRNNFNPHLQSFFLLTTVSVLNELVKANGNQFPGKGITYKRALIKKGEIAMSKIIQKLGYNLAVSLPDGTVFKFGKNNIFDNGYNRWKLNYSDLRLTTPNPNSISQIRKE